MRCSATSEVASRPATTVLVLVRLRSERARRAARQDCSFANKQESPPALLVVVRSRPLVRARRRPHPGVEERSRPARISLAITADRSRGERGLADVPRDLSNG
jgi:hypothetical protein